MSVSASVVDWSSTPTDAVVAQIGTDVIAGLTDEEAARRLAAFGPNTLREAPQRGPLVVLLAQFRDVTVLVLIAAAIVSGIVGEVADTIAIAVIVVLDALLGAIQEYRAERAVAALRRLATPSARVRRNGIVQSVSASTLVPGDVLLVEAGNLVPADARLLEVAQLTIDESTLTGESVPAHKTANELEPAAALGDRHNMLYQGTAVVGGRGVGVVVATGMRTELGHVAALLQDETSGPTPLQRRLAVFSRRLAAGAVAMCVVILLAGLARGENFGVMLMTSLSIAVAAIPEALPAVVTMSLAFGARRLVRRNALMRRLPAVEALGSVTIICSDKTGTLTENRMRVEWPAEPSSDVLVAIALCNDAVDGEGDPTETALAAFAARHGFSRTMLERTHPRIAEIPFSAERAAMTTVHRFDDGSVAAFTKGAPERVLAQCVDHAQAATSELRDREATTRGPLDREATLREAAALASDGLRVLAVATRRADRLPATVAELEQDQTFLGFVGLVDPPRAAAKEAIAVCARAGIRVVMITGDHAGTALAIARRLGIAESDAQVLRGAELRTLTDDAFAERVEAIRVYARVAPEDKIRIVKALQRRGELVAMTGDGVNDSPALRRADIGIAMGRGGTDIAREAAAMVLLDDELATIAAAVREGRRIYDNIRKFVRYTLAGNTGEIVTLFAAPFVGLPLPLVPIQILWVNLVTDGLPGLALASEPAEADVMERPPRPPSESVLARGLWQHVVWVGLLIGLLTLTTQALWLSRGLDTWRTMAFTVLTFAQMGHVIVIRSERTSIFTLGLWTNRPLAGAVALTIALQLAVIYVPAMQPILRTTALSAGELLAAIGISAIVPVAVEIEKGVRRASS